MDALLQAVKVVQDRLDRAGIRNAVIGGLAVGVWGRPRTTDDVDLKVAATRADVHKLIELLSPECSPADGAVQIAQSLGVLFLDSAFGVRVDLLLADMGFDYVALQRAVNADIQEGLTARFCTAEDLVLYKLITTRPRDVEDAKSVIREQGQKLDRAYVEKWLGQFEEALDDSTLLATFRSLR